MGELDEAALTTRLLRIRRALLAPPASWFMQTTL